MPLSDVSIILFDNEKLVSVVKSVTSVVHEVYGCSVVETLQQPMPSVGYNPSRGQYLASTFLEILSKLPVSNKAVGLVHQDLYSPGLNFVFGQAQVGGSCCVVATLRLDPLFYGEPPNPQLFIERTSKEVIHELGHTYGLGHCPRQTCVMHFSNSLLDTDRKNYQLCPSCRASLGLI